VRVTAAFNRLLALPGTTVGDVWFEPAQITVTVALGRRRLACADCSHSSRPAMTPAGSTPAGGTWTLAACGWSSRPNCAGSTAPSTGSAPSRSRSLGSSRAAPATWSILVAWLATRMDKSAVGRLVGVAWQTVGAIGARVVADQLDPGRLDALFKVGIHEVSWRKQHRSLTLVTDHRSGKVGWGAEGKDTATCDRFFTELGEQRSAQLTAVSTDMGAAYLQSVAKPGHPPQATVCIDPFHVLALATDALDTLRRQVWNQLRAIDPDKANKFKGARWVLLKRPERLTDDQAATLGKLRRHGGEAWRAEALKESLREVFAGDLTQREDRAAGPLVRQGQPQPSGSVRHPRRHDPQAPRRHPRRHPAGDQQRQGGGAQQQGAAHHPPRLRVPLRPGGARAGDARLRPDHPSPPPRANTCSPTFS